MFAVLLDFNGTMIFDSSLHKEAWSKIYWEIYPNATNSPDDSFFYGPRNDVILQRMAPFLTAEERDRLSKRKEELYRQAILQSPEPITLVKGVEPFLDRLQELGIPFGLASASIKDNIDFFYEHFALGRWFRLEDIVYDDGTYPDKGAMHLEAARRLNADLSDCLLIEDSPSSIGLASGNGAGCIVAIGSEASRDSLFKVGAHHFIRDFSEFSFQWLESTVQ